MELVWAGHANARSSTTWYVGMHYARSKMEMVRKYASPCESCITRNNSSSSNNNSDDNNSDDDNNNEPKLIQVFSDFDEAVPDSFALFSPDLIQVYTGFEGDLPTQSVKISKRTHMARGGKRTAIGV